MTNAELAHVGGLLYTLKRVKRGLRILEASAILTDAEKDLLGRLLQGTHAAIWSSPKDYEEVV
jgi:hypothetical protein